MSKNTSDDKNKKPRPERCDQYIDPEENNFPLGYKLSEISGAIDNAWRPLDKECDPQLTSFLDSAVKKLGIERPFVYVHPEGLSVNGLSFWEVPVTKGDSRKTADMFFIDEGASDGNHSRCLIGHELAHIGVAHKGTSQFFTDDERNLIFSALYENAKTAFNKLSSDKQKEVYGWWYKIEPSRLNNIELSQWSVNSLLGDIARSQRQEMLMDILADRIVPGNPCQKKEAEDAKRWYETKEYLREHPEENLSTHPPSRIREFLLSRLTDYPHAIPLPESSPITPPVPNLSTSSKARE